MKKTFLIILAVGFFIFAFLGFKAAFDIKNQTPSVQTQTIQDDLVGKQKNLLILHVDDLGSKNAKLVSTWGAFVFYSSPPQLMLVPLYPANTQEISDTLLSNFHMSSVGVIDEKTISAFREQYDLNIDGYILVDNSAVTTFQGWSGIQPETNANSGNDPQIISRILALEKKTLSNVCKGFKKEGPRAFLNKVRWAELIPGHFSTDFSFESMILSIDIFKTSGKLDSCEILLTP